MASLLQSISAVALPRLRAAAAKGTATGVELRAARITVDHREGVWRVTALVELRQKASGAGPVMFEAAAFGQQLESVDLINRVGRISLNSRSGFVGVELVEDENGWDGARIRFVLSYPGRMPDQGIVLPDALPALLSTPLVSGATPGPAMSLTVEPLPASLWLGGIVRSTTTSEYTQVALWPRAGLRPSEITGVAQPEIRYSVRLEEALRAHGSNLTTARIAELRDRVSRLLGSGDSFPLLVVDESELPWPRWALGGCVLALEPLDFEAAVKDWVAAEHKVARRIATAWWGRGITLWGENAPELQWALVTAAALLMAREDTGAARLGVLTDHYARVSRTSALRDAWNGARGLIRNRLVARWTLTLFERFQVESSLAASLRGVVRERWGNAISVAEMWGLLGAMPL